MSLSVLEKILLEKKNEIARLKKNMSVNLQLQMLKDAPSIRPFKKALESSIKTQQIALICEIKKASPSKGIICQDFNPAKIATLYQNAGATCLSILTDQKWFQGSQQHFIDARHACQLPMLRKDFIIDHWQIAQSRLMGADCILLIMAALKKHALLDYEQTAFEMGMDVLVEVHTQKELENAQDWMRTRLLGINNRNLKTLELSLDVGVNLLQHASKDHLLVSESGIYSFQDIQTLNEAGASAFLIGTSLMKEKDIALATRRLLGKQQ
ncbi:MAG: indole-3-glycerol phosphate synthase TrpC [Pseudomonadota bacterium]